MESDLASFHELMLDKVIEVQRSDHAVWDRATVKRMSASSSSNLIKLEFEGEEVETDVALFDDFTLHTARGLRHWRFLTTSTMQNEFSGISHQAQIWAQEAWRSIANREEDAEEDEGRFPGFICGPLASPPPQHDFLDLPPGRLASAECGDLAAFSAHCGEILRSQLSILSVQRFLNQEACFAQFLLPTALVVCENAFIHDLVCDELEFALDNYFIISPDSLPRANAAFALLAKIKRERIPLIMFTHCDSLVANGIDLLLPGLIAMNRKHFRIRLVFVLQDTALVLQQQRQDLVSCLDVSQFTMEAPGVLFAGLLHELVLGHSRIHLDLQTLRWLVNRFDRYDYSLSLFIQRVHALLLRRSQRSDDAREKETDDALPEIVHFIKAMGRHFGIFPQEDSAVVSKSILANALRWKELRLRILASGTETVLRLEEIARETLSIDALSRDGEADFFNAAGEEDASSSKPPGVARHKMGTKMRRMEGFKPAQQARSKRFCAFVDRLLAPYLSPSNGYGNGSGGGRGEEEKVLDALFNVVPWTELIKPALLSGKEEMPDLERDERVTIVFKLLRVVGTERELDLFQWFQAFCAELPDDGDDLGNTKHLQSFVRAICELKLLGVWDYVGRDKARKLFS